jgi:hypothetical protein
MTAQDYTIHYKPLFTTLQTMGVNVAGTRRLRQDTIRSSALKRARAGLERDRVLADLADGRVLGAAVLLV